MANPNPNPNPKRNPKPHPEPSPKPKPKPKPKPNQAAIASVNNSKFGIHVGLFTTDLNKSIYAWENCDVGGVVVGDVPSMRVDAQPYGGVKDSGIGCELTLALSLLVALSLTLTLTLTLARTRTLTEP